MRIMKIILKSAVIAIVTITLIGPGPCTAQEKAAASEIDRIFGCRTAASPGFRFRTGGNQTVRAGPGTCSSVKRKGRTILSQRKRPLVRECALGNTDPCAVSVHGILGTNSELGTETRPEMVFSDCHLFCLFRDD